MANKEVHLEDLIDEAALREIAGSVGRTLASQYGSNIENITAAVDGGGVELRLKASGFRDILMKFEGENTLSSRHTLQPCSDDEL